MWYVCFLYVRNVHFLLCKLLCDIILYLSVWRCSGLILTTASVLYPAFVLMVVCLCFPSSTRLFEVLFGSISPSRCVLFLHPLSMFRSALRVLGCVILSFSPLIFFCFCCSWFWSTRGGEYSMCRVGFLGRCCEGKFRLRWGSYQPRSLKEREMECVAIFIISSRVPL